MHCALQAAADYQLTSDQRVVVILPDSVRNYMYEFVYTIFIFFICFKHREVLNIIRLQCSAQHKMWPVVTHVVWFLCLSVCLYVCLLLARVLQKRLPFGVCTRSGPRGGCFGWGP